MCVHRVCPKTGQVVRKYHEIPVLTNVIRHLSPPTATVQRPSRKKSLIKWDMDRFAEPRLTPRLNPSLTPQTSAKRMHWSNHDGKESESPHRQPMFKGNRRRTHIQVVRRAKFATKRMLASL